MIKAHEYKDIRELSEAIESVCSTLSTGDVFYVEVDPAGYGPAGLPHSGAGILVVVLDPDYRSQLVAYRYEGAFTDDWATGDSDDVAREAFARLNAMKEK